MSADLVSRARDLAHRAHAGQVDKAGRPYIEPGARVTYRAKPQIDGEAIAESWRCGLPVEEVMRKHGCSRSAAYKHHPSKAERKLA